MLVSCGEMAPERCGVMALEAYGEMVPVRYGVLALVAYGEMVLVAYGHEMVALTVKGGLLAGT